MTNDPTSNQPDFEQDSYVESNPQSADNERIRLQCGVEIFITSLTQTRTYSGMLEGFPNECFNRSLIQRTMEDLRKKHGGYVHLIEPSMTLCPEQGHAGKEPWLELPAIKCIAQFDSRSIGDFGSRLTVLWYQSHFVMPIEPSVLQQLQTLDWPKLAEAIDDF